MARNRITDSKAAQARKSEVLERNGHIRAQFLAGNVCERSSGIEWPLRLALLVLSAKHTPFQVTAQLCIDALFFGHCYVQSGMNVRVEAGK